MSIEQFEIELTDLIKLHELDKACETPSSDLAEFMVNCFMAYAEATRDKVEADNQRTDSSEVME